MNINTLNTNNLVIHEWDVFQLRNLLSKDKYLYSLSVVLSEVFRTKPNSYDYNLVQDLLVWKKNHTYTKETFDDFLLDLSIFKNAWAQTKTHHVDENKALVDAFEKHLPLFCPQKHFEELKTHRLKERIHRPILAVLKIRAEQWKKEAPNKTQDDLIDVLE